MSPADPVHLPEAAIAALQQGRKLEAIKVVRKVHRLSLKEAKERVEAYAAQHPELPAPAPAPLALTLRGCLTGLLLLTALLMTWRYLRPTGG